MSWELFQDIVEKFTDEDTPIDKIKKANKKFKDMWYDEGTLGEDATIKDYYDQLKVINTYEPQWGRADVGLIEESRKNLVSDLEKAFPNRGKGDYNFAEYQKAYAEKDPVKREKRLEYLRKQFDPSLKIPHLEKGRPYVESDVTEAILRGNLKKPKPEYEGPFGKLGEYFSKNAAARDKLFSMMGSMGRELVKPIQPGQEAAGALVPTLSRGLGKGQEEYAAKQAAAAKTALDLATAQQKISPLQYYSSKMQEARLMVPSSIEGGPDSAEGRRWIGKYLMSIGMPSQAVDLSATIDSLRMQLMQVGGDEQETKRIQGLIDQYNRQLEDIVTQSIGGSSVTNIIPYSPVA